MNRNTESHFATLPNVDIPRSVIDRSSGHTTTFNVGDLVPVYWTSILPGDTVDLTTSCVIRLQTPLTPLMGNLYCDTFAFFVPNRLLWSHWKEFVGENTAGAWAPTTTYTVPHVSSPANGWNSGTIADYLGIPVGVEFNATNGLMPIALPFRAYASICESWFRDQNVTQPLNIPLSDSDQVGSNGTNYVTDVVNGGMPFKVAKFHDMFTSCLPDPQKRSTPVTFPLISGNQANVYTSNTNHSMSGYPAMHVDQGDNFAAGQYPVFVRGTSGEIEIADQKYSTALPGSYLWFRPDNLYADLSSSVGSVTVNQLRLAFQMQKFYEKQARSGSRYREIIKGMFSTTVPDARAMIPEYLGGHRFPLQIHQVANTSQDTNSYLGDVGAVSNTSDIHADCVKSFTEWGIFMVVACVRYDHSYSQGLDREWTRDDYLSYYWPTFANIGEQPVYKYEIDATIRAGEDRKAVFGYNEAWSQYRYSRNLVSGEMRPGIQNSLAAWHLGDYYTAMPSLSDGWIREDKSNVDRVLSVTSSVSNQIFADFWFQNNMTRPMPVYSVPGLIDHF